MKIGVVGYGSIGTRHVRSIETLGHEAVVYDPVTRRDVRFERVIYEKCDAVVIATPTMFHQQAIRGCAERGKHMLVEKPIAKTDFGLRELLDLAETNKAVVMMGNNLRFHPCVKQTEKWIEESHIGRPIWAHFTCGAESIHYLNDGVVLNTGAHEVDLAMHLFGPAEVLMANATEEIADFLLVHETGVRSSFHLDFVTPHEIREAWIVGEEDKIGLEFRNRNASLGANAQAFGGSYEDDYLAEMMAFISRIGGDLAPGATGEDGLATLKVLLEVKRKAGLV